MSVSGGRRKSFAVAASLLMIVSILPAGTVSAGTVTQSAGNTAPDDTVPEASVDGPPVLLKSYAMERSEVGEQLGTPPQSGVDLAQSAATEGIGAFGDAVRAQQGGIDANITVSGPILMRRN